MTRLSPYLALSLLVLGGCVPTKLLSTESGVFPQKSEVDVVRHGSNGKYAFRIKNEYAWGRDELTLISGETLNGPPKRQFGRETRAYVLVFPKDSTPALGTTFRHTIPGFAYSADDSAVNIVKNDIEQTKIPAAIIPASLFSKSLESLLLDDKQGLSAVSNYVNANKSSPVTSFGITAVARDITVDYLPRDGALKIVSRVTPSSDAEKKKAYYFVADRIIKAKEVAYFIPMHVFKDRLDIKAFQDAANKSDHVFKRGDSFVISKSWSSPKIIAVGHSALGLTKRGKSKATIANGDSLVEVGLILSIKTNDIVAK